MAGGGGGGCRTFPVRLQGSFSQVPGGGCGGGGGCRTFPVRLQGSFSQVPGGGWGGGGGGGGVQDTPSEATRVFLSGSWRWLWNAVRDLRR